MFDDIKSTFTKSLSCGFFDQRSIYCAIKMYTQIMLCSALYYSFITMWQLYDVIL